MRSLVSIIVTCYNQEKYISGVLGSVLSQTYENWECIVIDDGSTDHSAEVIKKYQDKDERIHYHYKDNAGVSKARNTGFTLAKGEYIQFLDGDDLLLPRKLDKQMEIFNTDSEIHICICGHQHLFLDKNKIEHYSFEEPVNYPLEQLLFKWHNGLAFPNHAPLYKRSLWEKEEVPFPEDYPYRCEDWVFNVFVALKGKKYFFLKDILCSYVMTGNNFTSDGYQNSFSFLKAAIYLNDKIPEIYRIDFIDNSIKVALNRFMENNRIEILHSSKNWKIGYFLTRPFVLFFKTLKKIYESVI